MSVLCNRESFQPADLRSPVSLHDRYATDIRQEGDDLVFVFPDGFDRIDWAEKTTTRTGPAEMRLCRGQALEIVLFRRVKRHGRHSRLYLERELGLPELIAMLRSSATIEFLYGWYADGSVLWQCCLYQGEARQRTDEYIGQMELSFSHEGIDFYWNETIVDQSRT